MPSTLSFSHFSHQEISFDIISPLQKYFTKHFPAKFSFSNSCPFPTPTPDTSRWPGGLPVPLGEWAQQPRGFPHHDDVEPVLQAI